MKSDDGKFGCGLLILIIVGNLVFWGAVAYIVLHFIVKYW